MKPCGNAPTHLLSDTSHKVSSTATPVINRLVDDYPERAVRPMDPALAVIDALLEEFGDEWLAKCMFH